MLVYGCEMGWWCYPVSPPAPLFCDYFLCFEQNLNWLHKDTVVRLFISLKVNKVSQIHHIHDSYTLTVCTMFLNLYH